jgi:tRNA-splicing ligase RtcB (3'-phosphate/5'-hydroxy nucleic acid ligase)
MYFNKSTKKIDELLKSIQSLDEYQKHIILPDLHYKGKMEAPSSTAIATGDFIIPSLASAAINDGMSIIKLPFKKSEITDEIVKSFFSEINSHASKSKFDMNKYSLTKNELLDVCLHGASAVLGKFNLDSNIVKSMELNGVMNKDLTLQDIQRLVPKALLASKFGRGEFGLNFRGNHFLELQYVDKVNNKEYAPELNVTEDDVMVMTHLGPGPFTGNLLRLYTNREKIGPLHRGLYFFAKLYFHFIEGRRDDLSFSEAVKTFFNPKKYQSFDINSSLGRDMYKLIQIGTNYGYAYQLGTFTAIRDAVRKVQSQYNLSKGDAKLIWNVSHNSIYQETVEGRDQFVTRHNSVRTYKNTPTILAGSFDVPSCIGISHEPDNNNLLNTHDHGIGAIINRLKDLKKLKFTNRVSCRYFYKRGSLILEDTKKSKVYNSDSIEEIAEYFDEQKLFSPWFYVHPIATLKN